MCFFSLNFLLWKTSNMYKNTENMLVTQLQQLPALSQLPPCSGFFLKHIIDTIFHSLNNLVCLKGQESWKSQDHSSIIMPKKLTVVPLCQQTSLIVWKRFPAVGASPFYTCHCFVGSPALILSIADTQVDSQISFVSRRPLVDWLVVYPNLHAGREVDSVTGKPPECPTSRGVFSLLSLWVCGAAHVS